MSDLNERDEVTGISDLESNIEAMGVLHPPLVRERDETDDDEASYEVIVGQRRVLAAQDIQEEIPVLVGDWDDAEAIARSISENIDEITEEVGAGDRAQALLNLWKAMDNEGLPSSRDLSQRLGVPESTVSQWIEPLRDAWDADDFVGQSLANSLGVRKMAEIRKAAENTEEDIGEIAKRADEEDLTLDQVKDLRSYLEKGASLDMGIRQVTGDVKQVDDGPDEDDDETETDAGPDSINDTEDPDWITRSSTDGSGTSTDEDDANPWLDVPDDEDNTEMHFRVCVRDNDATALQTVADDRDMDGEWSDLTKVLIREEYSRVENDDESGIKIPTMLFRDEDEKAIHAVAEDRDVAGEWVELMQMLLREEYARLKGGRLARSPTEL